MQIEYPRLGRLDGVLKEAPSESLDFIVLITGAFSNASERDFSAYLDECARTLKPGGLLFVQGWPENLPKLGVYLNQKLTFKYWIALESSLWRTSAGFPSTHSGILLYAKGDKFNPRKVRFPHERCSHCRRTLRDWGGKTHLMNPAGRTISDVWTELPSADNYNYLSTPALETILQMIDPSSSTAQGGNRRSTRSRLKGIVGPKEGIKDKKKGVVSAPRADATSASLGSRNSFRFNRPRSLQMNIVHQGDALEILKQYPANSIDLVFADPPYNLQKGYGVYNDERDDERYLEWCNAWLKQYVRILRPGGSLYLLNLPKWAVHHADFLNRRLAFQNWIVWDSLAEPRGKLMPAHYSLLYYTKGLTNITFNYDSLSKIDSRDYCLRASCIGQRKSNGIDKKEALTDIWQDIHRIKHKRDRDYHPCQLPDALIERIIRLSTNEGDIVLDALCGTGTTPVVAAKLGRRYVGIDLDGQYVKIARRKLAEVESQGYVERQVTRKPKRDHSKKALQLELRNLAHKLGRLPTPADVKKLSEFKVETYLSLFPSWGKALKAAKLEIPGDQQ